jgi:hypothetical protein
MTSPMKALTDLAEGQWGLLTTRQAKQAGVASSTLDFLHREGLLDRVLRGAYRVRAAGEPDYLALRAAWLQLDPGRPAWARLDDPSVALVSHSSAASLYGVGDLRGDVHEFTLPVRRQTERSDVRLHRGLVPGRDRILLHGLPTTRAGRMVRDLLADHVDPNQVAQITAEVVDHVFDYPRVIAENIAPFAARFGYRKGDGVGLLDHLLTLAHYKDKGEMLAMAGPQ